MIDEKFAGEIINCLINEVRQPLSSYNDTRPPWNIELAVQCLSEVRNLSTLAEAARRLLKVVCSLLEYYRTDIRLEHYEVSKEQFLEKQVVTFVETIGHNCPHRRVLVEWLRELKVFDVRWHWATLVGKFIGSVGKGLHEIHQAIFKYATHSDNAYRILAQFALVKGWRNDPQTLPILQDHAVNDSDDYVRGAAVSALAQNFRDDPQTLPMLQNRVENDPSQRVRKEAKWLADNLSADK
ncbi:MAG: HEAT repeat domain-containing protein [Deltaproteobacteria bacterium]|nr:HEAT repeat domain-containing protein [Deltaproteobacteria bacterium]